MFSERTGKLVGFVHDGWRVASHVLVFMVVGLSKPAIKFTLGHFGTSGLSADALYPLIWKAVGLIENKIGLKVGSVNSTVLSVSILHVQFAASDLY